MIISKTPFRVSFFGGGTDIPSWFLKEGGQVLSTTIDKYCYVTARYLPPFFNHSIRLTYSRVETVNSSDEVIHPLVRVILQDLNVNNIEIHYDSDLPGRSGLGTSSSFGAGLVQALLGLKGKMVSKKEMADMVIRYERHLLKEPGGYQDQVAASYGGFNRICFKTDGSYSVNPLTIAPHRLKQLEDFLLMCYIPIKRFSGDTSLANNFDKEKNEKHLQCIYQNVETAIDILFNGDIRDFGLLMNETWQHKRQIERVTNDVIDEIYETACNAGALGGKLLGAGGGGFMLLFCEKEKQKYLKSALNKQLFIPFRFEANGCQIMYYYQSTNDVSQ